MEIELVSDEQESCPGIRAVGWMALDLQNASGVALSRKVIELDAGSAYRLILSRRETNRIARTTQPAAVSGSGGGQELRLGSLQPLPDPGAVTDHRLSGSERGGCRLPERGPRRQAVSGADRR